MSSFIGVFNGGEDILNKIKQAYSFLTPSIETPICTIFSNQKTDRLFYSQESSVKWIVSGIGIHPYPTLSLVTETDWSQLFSSRSQDIPTLNGHFAGIKLDNEKVELFTDQIGMRSIYTVKLKNAVIFSTRIDWLLPFSNGSIDWEVFGEHWLSINAFSKHLFVRGIQRIHCSAPCTLTQNGIHVTHKQWTPTPKYIDLESYLFDLTAALFKKNNQLSLGLSGGLDSRFLLGILAGNSSINFDLFTFSGCDHPDERIAIRLNEMVKKPHQLLEYTQDHFNMDDLSNLSVRSLLNASIPELFANKLYSILGNQHRVSIDGGIGEIGRRRFLRSVEFKAKKAILAKNAHALAPLFLNQKADIFNAEITQWMTNGFNQSFDTFLDTMPTPSPDSIGNWLDLFSLRSRVPNIAGYNQELVDETHFHIMPFVQPDFLNGIMHYALSKRLNATWYRYIITKHLKRSTRLPLVKGDGFYPFWMKDISSSVWLKLKTYFSKPYKNTLLVNTLRSNKEQILDLLSPNAIVNKHCYDPEKVNSLLSSFYEDHNNNVATAVNWLLNFELFRQKLDHEFS